MQGFGAVGRHAARFLGEKGAVLVAAADSSATVCAPTGLDVSDLIRHKLAGGQLADYPTGKKESLDAIIDVACGIWIPAARPDVLHAGNAARLQAKLVAQGANIPATAEAEAALHARGVLVLPDFIANGSRRHCRRRPAPRLPPQRVSPLHRLRLGEDRGFHGVEASNGAGGVICAAVEYHGGTEAAAFAAIVEKIGRNMSQVLEQASRTNSMPRAAAVELAEQRVKQAAGYRRWR